MEKFHQQILLLLSVPIYGLLIPLEIFLSHFHHLKRYSWKETLMNLYLQGINMLVDLLLRGVALGVLIYCYRYRLEIAWSPVLYWLVLFLMEDLLFWLEHFVDHRVRFFWAVHVTHHSSEEYNLTTGIRSSVLMPFYRYMYFIPLALMGFRPLDIFFMYALTQTYGILLHTQAIHRLPRWIEYVFVTPSHHRVHHARNIPYLDKNMGMVLIIWDRIFGTFAEERAEEPPVYGILKPAPEPFHPIGSIFHEWKNVRDDLRKTPSLTKKLGYLFRPPGWSHDGSSQTARDMQDAYVRSAQAGTPKDAPDPLHHTDTVSRS